MCFKQNSFLQQKWQWNANHGMAFLLYGELRAGSTYTSAFHIFRKAFPEEVGKLDPKQLQKRREATSQGGMRQKRGDYASMKLMTDTTKACPKCRSLIEKNGGCPHMTCAFCGEQFCWKCGKNYFDCRQLGCGFR